MRRALAILVALAIGAAVGRVSAPNGAPSPGFPLIPGPSHQVAGVGVGYAHNRAGAALAAAHYQQAFADVAILRPAALRHRIETVATPDFAATMLSANSPGAERLAGGALGEGVRSGIATVYFGAPVGYRLLSYSPRRAVVQTWGFTVLGNASALEPSAYFGQSRTELVWMAGDWKIADTRASFGPTPRLATPRRAGEGFELVELGRELRPYGLAP